MSSPNEVREARKPRVFKTFDIDELSLVDIPAQQPALLAIRKAKDGEQLSDRIEDPNLDPEEKKKLAAKLNPNYGKSILTRLGRAAFNRFAAPRLATAQASLNPISEGIKQLGETSRDAIKYGAVTYLVNRGGKAALRGARNLRAAQLRRGRIKQRGLAAESASAVARAAQTGKRVDRLRAAGAVFAEQRKGRTSRLVSNLAHGTAIGGATGAAIGAASLTGAGVAAGAIGGAGAGALTGLGRHAFREVGGAFRESGKRIAAQRSVLDRAAQQAALKPLARRQEQMGSKLTERLKARAQAAETARTGVRSRVIDERLAANREDAIVRLGRTLQNRMARNRSRAMLAQSATQRKIGAAKGRRTAAENRRKAREKREAERRDEEARRAKAAEGKAERDRRAKKKADELKAKARAAKTPASRSTGQRSAQAHPNAQAGNRRQA